MKNRYILMEPEAGGEPQPTGGGEPSGLPSDNQPPAEGSVSFEINPDDLQDGKFGGKWESPQQMAEHIKSIEDKYANLKRDVTTQEKQTDEEIAATAAEVQREQLKTDTVNELLPEFLANGMVVTDEIKARLQEVGISEQEIKLGAYEAKEAVDKHASYVGGKENYDIIMDYHAANMTDDEKRAFNHSIKDPKHSQALLVGLQAMYEKAQSENPSETPQERVRGNVNVNNSIQPYANKQELLKDKKYADSRVASSSDKAKFRARLSATPDSVWLS